MKDVLPTAASPAKTTWVENNSNHYNFNLQFPIWRGPHLIGSIWGTRRLQVPPLPLLLPPTHVKSDQGEYVVKTHLSTQEEEEEEEQEEEVTWGDAAEQYSVTGFVDDVLLAHLDHNPVKDLL